MRCHQFAAVGAVVVGVGNDRKRTSKRARVRAKGAARGGERETCGRRRAEGKEWEVSWTRKLEKREVVEGTEMGVIRTA